MNHKVILLDDDYNLDDDLPAELDLGAMKVDEEQTRRFRALAAVRQLHLDPEVVEFFKTPEAINEALREMMNQRLRAVA